MKKLIVLVVVLAAFSAAVVTPLVLANQFNRQTLEKLLHKKPPEEPAKAEGPEKKDESDPLIEAIKQRQK